MLLEVRTNLCYETCAPMYDHKREDLQVESRKIYSFDMIRASSLLQLLVFSFSDYNLL